eukprot:7215669-Alexandrium_andersonii.AAC.1
MPTLQGPWRGGETPGKAWSTQRSATWLVCNQRSATGRIITDSLRRRAFETPRGLRKPRTA